MTILNKENRYVLGKADGYGNGRKSCECAITWTLTEDGRFSMCAEVWNNLRTDIIRGGQCVDYVAGLFPNDKKAQRMTAIWKDWHLNDMQAGSPRQAAHLKTLEGQFEAAQKTAGRYLSHYDWACKVLEDAGMQPDMEYLYNGAPYRYGSAWLKSELPQEVIDEIMTW